MKVMHKLNARRIAEAVPNSRHGDGGGLMLQVDDRGNKSWIFRFSINGRPRAMGLGPLNTVALADARGRARECRRLLLDGIDPLAAKRDRKKQALLASASRMTFSACADAYYNEHRKEWKSEKHAKQWLDSVALAPFGRLDVGDIDTAAIVGFLQPMWSKTHASASRLRGRIEAVLNWAGARGFRQGENPARWRGHLEHLLAGAPAGEHHAALAYTEVGTFMQELRALPGAAAQCLEFAILTAVRTREAIGCQWSEIDFYTSVWTIPAERMKSRQPHRVPLSSPALDLLNGTPRSSDYVFAGLEPGAPMSDRVLWAICRKLRSDATPHGMRSAFSDWARERTSFDRDTVERCLAHTVRDKTERAYHRGDVLDKRRQLMERWGVFCSTPSTAAGNVVAING
jgi:integrase